MNPTETSEKNKTISVSNDRMTKAIASVVESFDIEFARLENEETSVKILSSFVGLYGSTNLFSFFVPVSFQETTQYFMTDVTLRNFLLNYTERVSMSFATKDLTYDESFIDLMARHITLCKVSPESTYSLINKEVLNSLYVNQEVLKSLLRDNFWLTVLYLLLVNFQLSTVFKATVKEA